MFDLNRKTKFLGLLSFLFLLLSLSIFAFNSSLAPQYLSSEEFRLDDQEATIRAIERNQSGVVNITVYLERDSLELDPDTGQELWSKKKTERGVGTGFLVSDNGYILTNKHVVETDHPGDTHYRIILSSGQKYYAQLIDSDPFNDLAVLKIHDKGLPSLDLGNSDQLVVGSTVLAIGNALGKYQNTVTKGIVSGLDRDFVAQTLDGRSQVLNNIIQTDAGINLGNSGGPLINLEGEVVGVNVAVDRSGDSLGFAIPINEVKPVIESVKEHGIIIRPRLGVSYQMITPEMAIDQDLVRDSGALIAPAQDGESGVLPGSPAAEAGLEQGDIIFEINAIEINQDNTLRSVIQNFQPGDRIGLKVQRDHNIFIREVVLERFD